VLQCVLQYVAVCCRARQSHERTVCIASRSIRAFASPCNTLQHTATHCNTLQHPATPCNTRQHTATAIARNTLQQHSHATNNIYLQHTATHCNTLQHTATTFACNKQHLSAAHTKRAATQDNHAATQLQHRLFACNTHPDLGSPTQTYKYTHTNTHTYTLGIHTHSHTRTLSRMHTHTHTHAQTHVYTFAKLAALFSFKNALKSSMT